MRHWAVFLVRQCTPWSLPPGKHRKQLQIQIAEIHANEQERGLPLPGWLEVR